MIGAWASPAVITPISPRWVIVLKNKLSALCDGAAREPVFYPVPIASVFHVVIPCSGRSGAGILKTKKIIKNNTKNISVSKN
jgi:hypothetical protein